MNKTYKDLMAADGFELGTARTITPEGFLEAPATIARTGVQLYRARELGLDKHGVPPDQIVRLHRPHEELFNPQTISSFNAKPVIVEPHKTVNADNWRDIAVGDVHTPIANGATLDVAKLVVRDKDAVDKVLSGKKYLSIGYKFDVDMTPGTTAEGAQYDGVQRNIVGNHVAITSNPRGGFGMAIADSASVIEQKEKKMRKVIINSVPVEVGDSEAGIIESLIAERDAARNTQPKVVYSGQTIVGDAIVKALEGKDAEIKTLKESQITNTQIEERVSARVAVIGDASTLVKDYDGKGKSNKQVHQEVLTKVTGEDAAAKSLVEAILGAKTIGDASEESLATAFRAVVAHKKQSGESTNGTRTTAGDTALAQALTSKKEGGVATGDAKPSGRDGFISRMNGAWRGQQNNK